MLVRHYSTSFNQRNHWATRLQGESSTAGPQEFLEPRAGRQVFSCLCSSLCISHILSHSMENARNQRGCLVRLHFTSSTAERLPLSSCLTKFSGKTFFGLAWVRCPLLGPSALAQGCEGGGGGIFKELAAPLWSDGWIGVLLSRREDAGKIHIHLFLLIHPVNTYGACYVLGSGPCAVNKEPSKVSAIRGFRSQSQRQARNQCLPHPCPVLAQPDPLSRSIKKEEPLRCQWRGLSLGILPPWGADG